MLKGGFRALAGVLVALALGAGPAHAQVPDPLAPGPYGYKKIEYNAGQPDDHDPAGQRHREPDVPAAA